MAVVTSLDEARRRRAADGVAGAQGAGARARPRSVRHPAGSARRGTWAEAGTADIASALDTLSAVRGGPRPDPSPEEVDRLERAVMRLDLLARPDGGRERLCADVERDLLTVVGELAMGWIDRAAARAEELCDRLAAGR